MKHKRTLVALATAVLFGAGLTAQAEEKQAEPKQQTVCPVMGGKIDQSQYADVQGKRIYVCCAGCIGKIKAEPAKYIKQLESKGITLEKATAKKDTSASKGGCGGCGSH